MDGVLCAGGHPYDQCLAYPFAIEHLKRFKEEGYRLLYLTARYMEWCHGDRQKAHEKGYLELKDWMDRHGVPWDELHFGKPASILYADDRGFRVESEKGPRDWERLRAFLGLKK